MGSALANYADALQDTAELANQDLTKVSSTQLATLATNLDSAGTNPALNIVELLPEIGPEIAYLRSFSTIVVDILQPASIALEKSKDLLPESDGSKPDQPGFAINFEVYRQITKVLAPAYNAIGSLQTSLANRPEFKHLPVQDQLSTLTATLEENRFVIDELMRYLRIGRVVLDKPDQRWFIATQNLAEARATGGMIGSYVILRAKNNTITIEEVGTDSDLNAMQSLKDDWVPDEIRFLYDYVNWKDWRDINSWPETEPVAKAIKQGWDDGTGRPIDGVLFMGQGITGQLVALAGGVTVDGQQLTGDNTPSFFAIDIYLQYQDVDEKNAIVEAFSGILFDKLSTGPLQPADFIANIKAQPTGDKLFGWAADPELQASYGKEVLQSFALSDLKPNEIYFTSNNAGGNKLDAYLHYSFEETTNGLVLTIENRADPNKLTEYIGGREDLNGQGTNVSVGAARNYMSFFLRADYRPVSESTPNDPSCNLTRVHEGALYICDLEVAFRKQEQISSHGLAGFKTQISSPRFHPGTTRKLLSGSN